MPLVNYEYSDDEEEESDEEVNVSSGKSQVTKEENKPVANTNNSRESNDQDKRLFSKLPPPKTQSSLSTLLSSSLNDIVVNKKEKGPIKISAPSLRDFEIDDDEDEEEERRRAKRLKPSSSGTALTSLLPKPKNQFGGTSSAPLIPLSISRPKANLPPPRSLQKPAASSTNPRQTKKTTATSSAAVHDDLPDEEYSSGDFFSLATKSEETNAIGSDHESINTFKSVNIAPQMMEYERPSNSHYEPSYEQGPSYSNSPQPQPQPQPQQQKSRQKQQPELNDYTYKKLIASKFGEEAPDDINIIDIDVNKHLHGNNEWLKNISQEQPSEELKGEMPNSTARRKHQITYLAFQAKQREVDLKNQWALNKMTKSQTKAKYGF